MTNIEKIIFDAKFSVKYMNGKLAISSRLGVQTLHISEDNAVLTEVLERIVYFDEEDWANFVHGFKDAIWKY